jgi:hypothetical protein
MLRLPPPFWAVAYTLIAVGASLSCAARRAHRSAASRSERARPACGQEPGNRRGFTSCSQPGPARGRSVTPRGQSNVRSALRESTDLLRRLRRPKQKCAGARRPHWPTRTIRARSAA